MQCVNERERTVKHFVIVKMLFYRVAQFALLYEFKNTYAEELFYPCIPTLSRFLGHQPQ